MSARELSAEKSVRRGEFARASRGCSCGWRPGRPGDGLLPTRGGTAVRHLRARRFDRTGLARALGLADSLYAAPLQPAARPSLPGRSGWLSDARRGDCLPGALCGDLRAADRAQQRGTPAFPRGRALRCRSRPADGHRRPCRGRDRAVPDTVRARARTGRAYGKSTAPATGSRATCPKEPCSWSGAETRASRSPRSFRPRKSSSPSVRSRSRCRSASPAAISSGG